MEIRGATACYDGNDRGIDDDCEAGRCYSYEVTGMLRRWDSKIIFGDSEISIIGGGRQSPDKEVFLCLDRPTGSPARL